MNTREKCTIADCNETNYAKGLCRVHYQRARNGRDMTRPFSAHGVVALTTPRVRKELADAIKEQARRDDVSEYQIIRRILEAWYSDWLELNPDAAAAVYDPSSENDITPT